MKILILSDIHDHVWNLEKLINKVKNAVDAAVFCGDMCSPFSAGLLGKLGVPSYACLGNNDVDHIGLLKKSGDKFTWFFQSQDYGSVELGGKKIAFCHYPKKGEQLVKTGNYNAVFYGHTHKKKNEKHRKTLLVNPGSVCGIVDGRDSAPSYGIYTTDTNEIDILDIA